MNKTLLIGCIFFITSTTSLAEDEKLFSGSNKGYYLSDAVATDENLDLRQQLDFTNKNLRELTYGKLPKKQKPMLDDLPIGAVIPFVIPPGGLNLSENRVISFGQKITDQESPFFGQKVPDLNGVFTPFQPTYIAGTLDSGKYRKYFGNNQLQNSNGHTHQVNGGASGAHGADNDNDLVAARSHNHNYTSSNSGVHNHGGNNMPRTIGLVFIIRIK